MERPIKMFSDNEATVEFSNNNKSSSACKYMEVKFLIVKERIRDHLASLKHIGVILLQGHFPQYVPSENMYLR